MKDSTGTSNNPGIGGRGKKAPYDTTLTRIPIALKSTVESLASKYRELVGEFEDSLDENLIAAVATKELSQPEKAEIILQAIETYVQYRSQSYRPTFKPVDISTRGWDELRKFKVMLLKNPEKLCGTAGNTTAAQKNHL
jgi:hypothetical protein